jgi:hypothetical protein
MSTSSLGRSVSQLSHALGGRSVGGDRGRRALRGDSVHGLRRRRARPVYEHVGSRIGTRKEQREVSAAFAAGGLALLLGGLGTGLRWRGRLA